MVELALPADTPVSPIHKKSHFSRIMTPPAGEGTAYTLAHQKTFRLTSIYTCVYPPPFQPHLIDPRLIPRKAIAALSALISTPVPP